MASSGTTFFVFACLLTAGNAVFVQMKCNAENVAQHGGPSVIQCVVQTSEEVEDVTIRVVTWKKEGAEDSLLAYTHGNLEGQPGYRFAESSWGDKNMNISLLITNTAVTDDGNYTCMVITDSGDAESTATLKVRATYSAPTIHSIPENIVPNEDSVLICSSDGGYPQGQLRWFDEHRKDWTVSSEMKVTKMAGGTFQLTSTLPLLRGSTFSKYTCIVYNASAGKESETTFEILPTAGGLGGDNNNNSLATNIVAPVVVIGSLIVGLLLVVLFYRRRSRHHHKEVPRHEFDVEEGANTADG